MMSESSEVSLTSARPNTREALLDAAELLFGDRGYEAVGIREIVEHAQANLAAIKYHFGSKRDLYNETVRRLLDRARASVNMWDQLQGPFNSQREAAEALGAFAGLHVIGVLHGGPSTSAARLFLMEAIWPSEAFSDVIEEHFKPCMQKLESVIQAVNPRIDATEAATLASSVMAPLAYQRIYRRIIDSMGTEEQSIETHAVHLAASIVAFTVRGIGGHEELCQHAIESSREAIRSVVQRTDESHGQNTD